MISHTHYIRGLTVIFADDTTFMLYAKNYKELNEKIKMTFKHLHERFSANVGMFKTSKSNLMLFLGINFMNLPII